jgi:hypothetical protein
MHDQVSAAFRKAISESLPVAQDLGARLLEPYLVWRKCGEQQWTGEYEQRPSWGTIFIAGRGAFDKIGAQFVDAFARHYPQYRGLVGFPSLGLMSVLRDPSHIFGLALVTLWDRHGSFSVGADAVEVIVKEFGEFVDQPVVRFRFLAQLLNFHMPVERIELPAGLRIRRLSEEEVSEIYGGPAFQVRMSPHRGFGTQEFAIEGDHEERKVFGEQEPDTSVGYSQVRAPLDKAIQALRTFKEGRVGYDYIRFKAVKFCPLPLPGLGFGDLYVPFGAYDISTEEIEPLRQHAGRIFAFSEQAMEMACSRLADAQTRLRPQDRLVDAVIGLEALLLAGLSADDRRGELKHRFSLNYSTLFGTPEERHRAFRIAKDLYDLRSTVAHGGVLKEGNCRVGNVRLTIDDAAKRACEVLRGVINHFLAHTGAPDYRNPQYWERGYFGLPLDS